MYGTDEVQNRRKRQKSQSPNSCDGMSKHIRPFGACLHEMLQYNCCNECTTEVKVDVNVANKNIAK